MLQQYIMIKRDNANILNSKGRERQTISKSDKVWNLKSK